MERLLPEHINLGSSFLENKEKLILGTTGDRYSCVLKKNVIQSMRKKAIRILCANLFKAMFSFDDNSILYETKEDMMDDMDSMKYYSKKLKMSCLFEMYYKWISTYIIRKYNYNDMEIGNEEIKFHRNRSRYRPKKFAYSPYPFNHPMDKTSIRSPNRMCISIVYRVRTIGIQYKTIKESLQLKALVG